MVTGIEPTPSGLLDQRRSRSDNQDPCRPSTGMKFLATFCSENLKLLSLMLYLFDGNRTHDVWFVRPASYRRADNQAPSTALKAEEKMIKVKISHLSDTQHN